MAQKPRGAAAEAKPTQQQQPLRVGGDETSVEALLCSALLCYRGSRSRWSELRFERALGG